MRETLELRHRPFLRLDPESPDYIGSAGGYGFYGVAPVARPSAYTLGNAGVSKTTHPTVGLVGSDYASESVTIQEALNNCLAVLNALITDLKALGLVQ